jgi:nucleotide-binding universal stress UspA family protein
MFQLQRILVPIDFSDNSVTATSQAGALARRFRSEITLLHVSEFLGGYALSGPLGYGITSDEAERAEQLSRLRKQLEEFARADLSGLSVKRILCCGDPAKVIVQRARDEKSDLIVMSTRGQGVFRRFLLGSVTAKVLHDAECPVWTGAHLAELSASSPADIRHVMCAVNLGPQSSDEIRWAASFAEESAATLTVAHVVLDNPPNLPERYMFQWHEEAHWGAEERLRTLLLDLGLHADVLVVSDGDIPKAISNAAKENEAGLLVIGRSCAGRASRPLGSHAYSVICNAPCPVVSV